MDQKGIRQAIIYGLTPNRLGLCGPGEKHELLYQWLIEPERAYLNEVIRVLENFEAAYPYYELIAQENQIKDPFAAPVVEAYWIGNGLLEEVSVESLRRLVESKFSLPHLLGRVKARKKAKSVPQKAKPHHSFHVLFLGSVTGRVPYEAKYLDMCRVSWGKIIELRDSQAVVKYQPLKEKKGRFFLASGVGKVLSLDTKIVPGLKAGETVSFHWGQVCERLTKAQEEALVHYTLESLDLVNSWRRK